MKALFSAIAVLFSSVAAVSAQGVQFKSATFTLGYEGFAYPGGPDEASKSFSSTFDFGFGGSFGLSGALNYHDLSNYPTEDYYSFTLRPYYTVNSSLDVGLIIEQNTRTVPVGGQSGTLYGIDFGYYSPNGFAATGYVATGQDFLESDADFAGLTAGYGLSNGFDFGAYVKTARYDGGNISRYGLTAGYLFAGDSLSFPVYLSGYVGTQEVGSDSFDTMGLGLTVPLGNARLGRGQRPSAYSHDTEYEYYE